MFVCVWTKVAKVYWKPSWFVRREEKVLAAFSVLLVGKEGRRKYYQHSVLFVRKEKVLSTLFVLFVGKEGRRKYYHPSLCCLLGREEGESAITTLCIAKEGWKEKVLSLLSVLFVGKEGRRKYYPHSVLQEIQVTREPRAVQPRSASVSTPSRGSVRSEPLTDDTSSISAHSDASVDSLVFEANFGEFWPLGFQGNLAAQPKARRDVWRQPPENGRQLGLIRLRAAKVDFYIGDNFYDNARRLFLETGWEKWIEIVVWN